MPDSNPLADYDYAAGCLAEALEFLKRTRSELSILRKVRVWADRVQVFDVNADYFEVTGIGYASDDIIPLLDAVNTAYRRDTIHEPVDAAYKEFKTGRRHPWAEDRVM